MDRTLWYKDCVFYQIWPRSFKDGNGDGKGDLWGVLEKLDYIKSLGCDGIWFSPLYPSPFADCGYDVSNYTDIAEEYGGMEAFDRVLAAAHERGLRVIMDLVVNHTSDEHEWFEKSRRRIDPYTDYYIWRPARKNGKLPNNWDSLFEGKAWQWDEVRQEYYLHLFAIKQPDLNMDNPLVREEVKKIQRFWLDKGVDGFREDVITFISKKEGLPNDYFMPAAKGMPYYNHGPHLHEYLQEFYRDVFSKYDCMILAESPMVSPKKALEYITETGSNELDMMIQFDTMGADCLFSDQIQLPFSLRKLKKSLTKWENGLAGKAWNMLYIENHDHARIVDRYGDALHREQSAKLLGAMYLFLQGTPFVYQGQELGMVNYPAASIDDYEDVQTLNWKKNASDKARLKLYASASRDHARTPVQWDASENAGFSTPRPDGAADEPWFHVNPNYTFLNASNEDGDPNSVLNFYRRAIALRKSLPVVKDGVYRELRKGSRRFYAYTRENENEKLLVVAHFGNKNRFFRLPKAFRGAEVILNNYPAPASTASKPDTKNGFTARAWEVRVYKL